MPYLHMLKFSTFHSIIFISHHTQQLIPPISIPSTPQADTQR